MMYFNIFQNGTYAISSKQYNAAQVYDIPDYDPRRSYSCVNGVIVSKSKPSTDIEALNENKIGADVREAINSV